MTEDTSATILTEYLIAQIPFFYLRYGDGALECIHKKGAGKTCDGELYTDELAKALLDGWNTATKGTNVFIGDWRTTSFKATDYTYTNEYEALIAGKDLNFIHFHALLLRNSAPLLNFYQALRSDKRRKLYVGPFQHSPVVDILKVKHLPVPIIPNLFNTVDILTEALEKSNCEIILYGAGMAGAIAALRCFEKYPKRTYVHLGSALDPLFRGRTRSDQIHPREAKDLFSELV